MMLDICYETWVQLSSFHLAGMASALTILRYAYDVKEDFFLLALRHMHLTETRPCAHNWNS